MSSRRRQTPPPPRVPPPVQNQTDPRYTLSASGFPLPPRQTVIPTRFSQIQGPDAPTRFERCGLAGCEVIRAEAASGAPYGRAELQVLLDFLRAGDTLVATRIDRLARSLKDLQDIVYELKAKGIALKATEQPIDTGTAAGKAFLDMLGVFAEFETNLRRERQMEGIAKAKAAGVYKGRKPTISGPGKPGRESGSC